MKKQPSYQSIAPVSWGRTPHPWDLISLAKLFTPYLYKHVSGWLGQRSRLTSEPMTLQEALGDTD